jgi:hypothetical protein
MDSNVSSKGDFSSDSFSVCLRLSLFSRMGRDRRENGRVLQVKQVFVVSSHDEIQSNATSSNLSPFLSHLFVSKNLPFCSPSGGAELRRPGIVQI